MNSYVIEIRFCMCKRNTFSGNGLRKLEYKENSTLDR